MPQRSSPDSSGRETGKKTEARFGQRGREFQYYRSRGATPRPPRASSRLLWQDLGWPDFESTNPARLSDPVAAGHGSIEPCQAAISYPFEAQAYIYICLPQLQKIALRFVGVYIQFQYSIGASEGALYPSWGAAAPPTLRRGSGGQQPPQEHLFRGVWGAGAPQGETKTLFLVPIYIYMWVLIGPHYLSVTGEENSPQGGLRG